MSEKIKVFEVSKASEQDRCYLFPDMSQLVAALADWDELEEADDITIRTVEMLESDFEALPEFRF